MLHLISLSLVEIKQNLKLFEHYLNNTHYKFQLNKYVYYKGHLFSLKDGTIIELDKLTSKILSVILSKSSFEVPAVVVNDRLKFLQNKKYICKTFIPKTPKYYKIFFEITNRCNLNCRYCFNRGAKRYFELDINDWKYIVDNVPEKTELTLFGGEPFMKEGIDKLFLYLDNKRSKNKNLDIRCFTNGYKTDEILRSLKPLKNSITLIVSVDGTNNRHDKIRGKNTYNNVIQTIKRIKSETKHKVWIKTLASNFNTNEIISLIDVAKELSVDYISFGELHLIGNAKDKTDELLSFKDDYALFEKIHNKIKDTKLIIREDNILRDYMVNRCGFGYNLVYIRSDGFIGGCTEKDVVKRHIFELYPNMSNFRDDPMRYVPDIFKTNMVNGDSYCMKCGLNNLCMGGCFSRSHNDKNKCDTYRKSKIEFLLNNLLK